jgi:hypothetical protein
MNVSQGQEVSFIPNSYPTPNCLVDQLMHLLEPKEWVVLSFIDRHILGWQDRLMTRTGAVSLSMIQNGFTTKDGIRYHGCGLSRPTIIAALDALLKFKIIETVGEANEDGQCYHIPDDDSAVDYRALQERLEGKRAKNHDRTEVARNIIRDKRLVSPIDQSVALTSQSDLPEVVSRIDQRWSVGLTESYPSKSNSNPYFVGCCFRNSDGG